MRTTFIDVDREILKRHFIVESVQARGVRAVMKLAFGIARCDVALAWFASVYSFFLVFLSKVLGKGSLIIVAGVDASKDKEIHYGIWLSPWKSVFVRAALRRADRVLVVDPFLGKEVVRLAQYDGHNVSTLPFGFDATYWKPKGPKEHVVLTVAACRSIWTFRKKGLDKLLEAARLMPDGRFIIVGVSQEVQTRIRPTLPPNVSVFPFVDQTSLLEQYQRAKVYCQVSYTEGLPNALCEAMLCECIPVGTMRGGIPTAIGDTGVLIPYGDVPAMVDAFRTALTMSDEEAKKARRRIVEQFPLGRREAGLVSTIRELLS